MQKITTTITLIIIYAITFSFFILFFYIQEDQKNEKKNMDKAIIKNLNIDFFDTNIKEKTSLAIEMAILDSDENITALKCSAKSDNVVAKTDFAKIYKNTNWLFKQPIIKRFHNQCHQEFTSKEIYYNPSTKEFFTNEKVNMIIGKSNFVMDGIIIPTKNQKIILGKNLYGQINPQEKCING